MTQFQDDLRVLIEQYHEMQSELASVNAALGAWAPIKAPGDGKPIWYAKLPIEERQAALDGVQKARLHEAERQNLAARQAALETSISSLEQQIAAMTELDIQAEEHVIDATLR